MDRPAAVDEAQGEIGLLHRISEVGWVSASPLEGFAADDDSAPQEGGDRTASIGPADRLGERDDGRSDPSSSTIRRATRRAVDSRAKVTTLASQDVRLGVAGVVVEEGDQRVRGPAWLRSCGRRECRGSRRRHDRTRSSLGSRGSADVPLATTTISTIGPS